MMIKRGNTQMKKVKRCMAIVLLLGIMLAQAVRVYAIEKTLPSGIDSNEIGIKIEEYVSEHMDTTAAMSVSIFRNDDTIYTNYFGYADKESGIAADQDTVMEWGSATKLLVWVSVMQLWEQGKLDLNADIREYLPEGFLSNLNFDAPITMIHLMNHNAGFQDGFADLFVKEYDAIGTLETSLTAHKPEQIYEPGTVTAYSNWGVALAGYIVERTSGQDFDDYVHQHIFDPLGMAHSAVSADLSDNAWVQEKRRELQCYSIDGTLIPNCFYYITLYPAGMCTSTLADFETFGKALLNADSPLFRERSTWETLFTPTAYFAGSELPSNYHGFWFLPYGVETVGHGGNTAGCSSYLLLDLQRGIGSVVMTNQSQETVYNLEMMELIYGSFSEEIYFDAERTAPEGIYRSARTIRTGPFKLISASFLFGDLLADEFWTTGTSGGVEKIGYPSSDFIRVPVWLFVLEVGLIVLWAAAVLFSVMSLIVKLIRKIVRASEKDRTVAPLERWSTIAALIQLTAVALLAAVALHAFGYALSSSYAWMIVAFGIILAVMVGLAIYGAAMLRKVESTGKLKCCNWAAVIFLAISVANIVYWNLFMFWQI